MGEVTDTDNDSVFDWHKTLFQNLDSSPHANNSLTRHHSLVFIKDHSSSSSADHPSGDNFSVFPPSNHENLVPSSCNLDPKHHPSPPSPSSPLSFPQSDFDYDSPSPSSSPPSPPVTLLPKWWNFAVQILRSRILCFGCNSGKRRSFWSFKSVSLVLAVVLWWVFLRVRQKRHRRKSVEQLLQIISEKDKKIMELLNQIAQMNEALLTRHKALTSKLAN